MLILELCSGFAEALLALAGVLFEATFVHGVAAVFQALDDAAGNDEVT